MKRPARAGVSCRVLAKLRNVFGENELAPPWGEAKVIKIVRTPARGNNASGIRPPAASWA